MVVVKEQRGSSQVFTAELVSCYWISYPILSLVEQIAIVSRNTQEADSWFSI